MGKSIILFLVVVMMVSACSTGSKSDIELYLSKTKNQSGGKINQLKKAFKLYEQRKVKQALALFKTIVKAGNNDSLVMYKYGLLLSKSGDNKGASQAYDSVSSNIGAEYPNHKYAKSVWLNLGNMAFRATNFKKSLNYYKKGFELGNRSKVIYYSLGMVYRRLEKYSLAAAYMEKADLTQFRVNFFLSAIYYELKKIDAALKRINVALSIRENDAKALGAKGNFLYMKAETMEKQKKCSKMNGFLKRSAECYKKAIANGGNIYSIHLKNVYGKLRKYRKSKGKKLSPTIK